MYILFSKADSLFPSQFQRFCTDSLSGKCRCHDPAESMRGIRHKSYLFFSGIFRIFYRIGIRQFMNRQFLSAASLHSYRLCKGTDTDPQRSLNITFIQFQNQRCFS